jgi:type IV pilus assembly protein PilB
MKLPRIDLSRRSIPEDILAYIPADKAWEYRAVPVDRKEMHGTLFLMVAMADPTNLDVIDSLQFMTGCRVRTALAFDSAVEDALLRFYGPSPSAADPGAQETAPKPHKLADISAVAVRPPIETTEERMQELLKILLEKGILSLREHDRLK